ncbi:MAG: hypothetical protein ACK5BF_09630, partial [Hyphomonadaceae bacterium]
IGKVFETVYSGHEGWFVRLDRRPDKWPTQPRQITVKAPNFTCAKFQVVENCKDWASARDLA